MEILIKKITKPFRVNYIWTLLLVLLLLWWSAPYWLYWIDHTAALIDPGVWMLVIMAIVAFLLLAGLSALLLNSALAVLGLPPVTIMVEHFEKLNLWQRMFLYWGSYALLLLAAVGSLLAIC